MLDDLKQAHADLEPWQERWDNYSGNNPNKYRSSIKSAGERVRTIEADLRRRGLLPAAPGASQP